MQPRQINTGITLLLGLGVGLLVGLLIGWVLWPVEWQGATVAELFPDAKAQYLAAVADAFAMYHDQDAAELAQRRLAALGANLPSDMEAAIAYFSSSTDPNKEIRIGNLSLLASALSISTPNLVGVTQLAQNGTPAANPTPIVSDDSSGTGWLTWLIEVLAGLALLLAGLYGLVWIVQQRRSTAARPLDDHIDHEIGSMSNAAPGAWERTARSYVAPDADSYSAKSNISSVTPLSRRDTQDAYQSADEEGYGFADEPDEMLTPSQAAGNYVAANRGSHFTQLRIEPAESEGDENEEEYLEEEDEDDGPPVIQRTTSGDMNSAARSGGRPAENLAPRSGAEAAGFNVTAPRSPQLEPLGAESIAASTRVDPGSRPAGYPRAITNSKYKLLELYTAQYQIGIRDYDESHPIMDAQTGKYIGECGMGASAKNSLLQNNPEQVVALEVWLFDKTDEKNLGSQTRVLLSEYAIDHHLDQAFIKERQDDPRPFTAQPNVRFQLESPNLLLDCTIVEAIYTPSGPTKGIFQSVKVEMAIHKKQ